MTAIHNTKLLGIASDKVCADLKQLCFVGKASQQLTAPTRNWRFSASYESFLVKQTLVLRMNICGENRQLLVAANR